jgi:DNA-binding CsgD family transcriptional regulator
MQSRAESTIGRHQFIVYLLHSALVTIVITMQLAGLGGSQDALPVTMSLVHLAVCLTMLTLFLRRRLSVQAAFTTVALVAQGTILCRFYYFSHVRPEQYLQFILLNQITSLLAVVFLVMCFVKYTPSVVTVISLTAFAALAAHLEEPALWRTFAFFSGVQFFLCVLGELMWRNVLHMQTENTDLHRRESALMHAVRLNEREIEGYLRMSSSDQPSADDVDRLFAMLKPKSQRNLINAVRQHLKHHLKDGARLSETFPMLTKSELDVCALVIQGKKRGEIAQLLDKTENNIDVVRTHIRRKLNVPNDRDLRNFLMEQAVEKRQARLK